MLWYRQTCKGYHRIKTLDSCKTNVFILISFISFRVNRVNIKSSLSPVVCIDLRASGLINIDMLRVCNTKFEAGLGGCQVGKHVKLQRLMVSEQRHCANNKKVQQQDSADLSKKHFLTINVCFLLLHRT